MTPNLPKAALNVTVKACRPETAVHSETCVLHDVDSGKGCYETLDFMSYHPLLVFLCTTDLKEYPQFRKLHQKWGLSAARANCAGLLLHTVFYSSLYFCLLQKHNQAQLVAVGFTRLELQISKASVSEIELCSSNEILSHRIEIANINTVLYVRSPEL